VKPLVTVGKFEEAMWFSDLPGHAAVHSAHRVASLDAEAHLLVVGRVIAPADANQAGPGSAALSRQPKAVGC
jgi:hypothetical protein